MTASTGQGEEHWKNKYYDQLDQLEKKEKNWTELESTLKRTIGRLSLAAEGQNDAVDRYIKDIRSVIKNDIECSKLESILDKLSKLLAKIEESNKSPDKIIINSLNDLLASLVLIKPQEKQKQKIIKQFSNSTDLDKDQYLKEIHLLINKSLSSTQQNNEKKPGFLNRILGKDNEAEKIIDVKSTAHIISHVTQLFPWPEVLKQRLTAVLNEIEKSENDDRLSSKIKKLEGLAAVWSEQSVNSGVSDKDLNEEQNKLGLESYRSCIVEFLDKFNNESAIDRKIDVLRNSARKAEARSELDQLSSELAEILIHSDVLKTDSHSGDKIIDIADVVEASNQPNIQELLIRLLEQLVVPGELHKKVEEIKTRLERHTEPADWKKLLKDVASLINSIRIRMQEEKHGFESFLQQITSRLKEMDAFLQNERQLIDAAEHNGIEFDEGVSGKVKEIHNDIKQADTIEGLKDLVENRLENISLHIKEYRDLEKKRYSLAKSDVYEIQNQMMSLEKESENLKTVIIEKNKEAMYDTLTEIPNRLAYEKKALEEIARWKRFSNELSFAVWDIDFF